MIHQQRTVFLPNRQLLVTKLTVAIAMMISVNGRPQSDNEVINQCPPGYTACETVDKCVHDTFFCDGDNDCGDNSDESFAFCRRHSCADDQVKCNNGQCIETEDFCSARTQCRDGSVRRNRRICPNIRPSFDMCFDHLIENCARPFSDEWTGMNPWQVRQKIIATSMDDICSSVTRAQRCANEAFSFGCHESDVDLMPEYYRQFRSDYDTFVDILCRQEINVLDRHKACLLGENSQRIDVFDMINSCIGDAASQDEGCGSAMFQRCLLGYVTRTCGVEISATVARHQSQVSHLLINYLIDTCRQLEHQR